jgi:uncharacterized membrane protein YhaH (DUF805 family)
MNHISFDILWLRIVNLFYRKKGRFAYFLSLLIVLVGCYYLFEFYNPNKCHVCNPIMGFPWKDLLEIFGFITIGGIYSCLFICLMATDNSILNCSIIFPILITLFYFVQAIRRCHDLDKSGWWMLLPIYSPLFLLFLPGKNKKKGYSVESIIITLWNSKWLILILIALCAYIYMGNAWFAHRHMELYEY